MIVRFVDIGGIADLHCLKFIFINTSVTTYDKIYIQQLLMAALCQ
jgi:hypothetical protein